MDGPDSDEELWQEDQEIEHSQEGVKEESHQACKGYKATGDNIEYANEMHTLRQRADDVILDWRELEDVGMKSRLRLLWLRGTGRRIDRRLSHHDTCLECAVGVV